MRGGVLGLGVTSDTEPSPATPGESSARSETTGLATQPLLLPSFRRSRAKALGGEHEHGELGAARLVRGQSSGVGGWRQRDRFPQMRLKATCSGSFLLGRKRRFSNYGTDRIRPSHPAGLPVSAPFTGEGRSSGGTIRPSSERSSAAAFRCSALSELPPMTITESPVYSSRPLPNSPDGTPRMLVNLLLGNLNSLK